MGLYLAPKAKVWLGVGSDLSWQQMKSQVESVPGILSSSDGMRRVERWSQRHLLRVV